MERGPGRDHSLVCMTTSEMDAVQAAAVQPWSKLFVAADSTAVHRWGVVNATTTADLKLQLLKKWREQRGPSWPKENGIVSFLASSAVARNPDVLVTEYAAAFQDADSVSFLKGKQNVVRRYRQLVAPLSACCGAQMDPSYRLRLHGLSARDAVSGGKAGKHGHECDLVDVDALEKEMLRDRVFQKCSAIDIIARLSPHDGPLTGHYCARARAATIKHKLPANHRRYKLL